MAAFKLSIKLGNAEMQTADNVGDALIELGRTLGGHHYGMVLADEPYTGAIRDVNGNTVGHWVVIR